MKRKGERGRGRGSPCAAAPPVPGLREGAAVLRGGGAKWARPPQSALQAAPTLSNVQSLQYSPTYAATAAGAACSRAGDLTKRVWFI